MEILTYCKEWLAISWQSFWSPLLQNKKCDDLLKISSNTFILQLALEVEYLSLIPNIPWLLFAYKAL